MVSACATHAPIKPVTQEEIRRRDQAVGSEIAQRFESRLQFTTNPAVAIYLRKLATDLLDSTPELRGAPVGIWLIRSKNGKWNRYALPGNRIYLPVELLRGIDYENEIAAEIAIQFSHLIDKHVLERLLKLQAGKHDNRLNEPGKIEDLLKSPYTRDFLWNPTLDVDYFGLSGIFAFSEEAEISAAKKAVSILYRAGFDPRGLISLFNRFRNNSKHSPYEMSTINKIIEQARHEIAMQAPLRNPIVRSKAFIKIQKRIHQL